MHRDLVEALHGYDLQPLRDWLADHRIETGTLRELPQWNSPLFPAPPRATRRSTDRTARAHAEVLAQLQKAAEAPGGVALLLLYVYLEVEAAWWISYHYPPMWDTLRGARGCLRDRWPLPEGADATLARAVLALMECLDAEIQAENAMTSGQLADRETAMETAVATAREAAGLAGISSGQYPELSAYLAGRATQHEAYYTVLGTTARGMRAFFESGEPLDSVIEALKAAEDNHEVALPMYAGGLRANRFTLIALNRERHEPWLRIDHGKLVYLYPFALRGAPAEIVVASIGQHAGGWRLAGSDVAAAYGSLELDDVWDGSDSLQRRYEGALVRLREVVISNADGRELGRVEAQIRFSKLGNHYVRFESDIRNVTCAELYTMMFRAAPEHGVLRVAFKDAPDEEWPRLADLAVRLAEDACQRLRESAGTARTQAVVRQGMFQVVLNVDAASTVAGPTDTGPRREVLTLDELTVAAGAQVLTNPVTYLVGTMAEWIRYATDTELSSAVTGLHGERIIRTSNTTVIAAPGAAAFAQDTRRSVAEFAASLDGLFAGWSLELAVYYGRVKDFQTRVDAAESGPGIGAQALSALSRELDDEKIRLNDFVVEARSIIALIRSPSLMKSPVVADSLRLMLDHSDFRRRVAELNVKIEEVAHEQLGVTIEKLARQRGEQEARAREEALQEEQRREHGQRVKLEIFLAVIAAAGISGIIQVLQAGFFESATAARWAAVAVMGIVAVATGLGFVFWRGTRQRR